MLKNTTFKRICQLFFVLLLAGCGGTTTVIRQGSHEIEIQHRTDAKVSYENAEEGIKFTVDGQGHPGVIDGIFQIWGAGKLKDLEEDD